MKYFKNVETLEELRKQYKELLKKYHPDNPTGSTEATQEVNAEYNELFKILKDRHESKANDNENKSDFTKKYYDFAEDKALRNMLNKIINFSDIKIEIIGNWIWCFDSYTYKKELKELGFKYAGQKKAWYYHTEAFRKKGHKALSMDDIRNYYGSTEIQAEENRYLKQA